MANVSLMCEFQHDEYRVKILSYMRSREYPLLNGNILFGTIVIVGKIKNPVAKINFDDGEINFNCTGEIVRTLLTNNKDNYHTDDRLYAIRLLKSLGILEKIKMNNFASENFLDLFKLEDELVNPARPNKIITVLS